ncbi:MAG: L-lactate dehydrogenase [Candidatus Tyloplasma litorale]|nr:MAG: L-lactate dehydrogenase [Mycoplasmatales bacterium]
MLYWKNMWKEIMKKTYNKIVLIGAGAVGTSFLYSAISQGIAEQYGIIDINTEGAFGNKLDLEDAFAALPSNGEITSGGYELVKDADVVVITAGRPQKPGETRLEMVADNAKIMKTIANQIKENGFSGITLIAANPVDVMTTVYQHVTGFEASRVISSSCALDTSRLKLELSKIFGLNPKEFGVFVLGEHGDSSVSTLSFGTIQGIPMKKYYEEYGLTDEKLEEMHTRVYKKAYEIIDRKRATFYGIGAALAEITKSILRNEKKVFATGALLSYEYGQEGVYAAVPSVIGSEGIIKTFEFPLSKNEKANFIKSVTTLKEATKIALDAIK